MTHEFLATYTTLRLGGPADRVIETHNSRETVEACQWVDSSGVPLLILAGGSNVVIGDAGFTGTVILLRDTGFHADVDPAGTVTLTVAAGHPWDELVQHCVEQGWSGLECLSGIPGSAGATPIQNVGAYGQEVAETITAVRVWDRQRREIRTLSNQDCGFAYRTSIFKGVDRWVVLDVTFQLQRSNLSGPIRYAELARTLGVTLGERVPLPDARAAVLHLRRGKGMVLDPDDPDTYSVGSFFTNPVLTNKGYAELRRRCAELLGDSVTPPSWPYGEEHVKTSAAWLIERAGFTRGYGRDGVGISSKHTLALTNRGSGTTAALLDLAREIRDGVRKTFDIELHPEPVLVGVTL